MGRHRAHALSVSAIQWSFADNKKSRSNLTQGNVVARGTKGVVQDWGPGSK